MSFGIDDHGCLSAVGEFGRFLKTVISGDDFYWLFKCFATSDPSCLWHLCPVFAFGGRPRIISR